jgi:hypothetical protein
MAARSSVNNPHTLVSVNKFTDSAEKTGRDPRAGVDLARLAPDGRPLISQQRNRRRLRHHSVRDRRASPHIQARNETIEALVIASLALALALALAA